MYTPQRTTTTTAAAAVSAAPGSVDVAIQVAGLQKLESEALRFKAEAQRCRSLAVGLARQLSQYKLEEVRRCTTTTRGRCDTPHSTSSSPPGDARVSAECADAIRCFGMPPAAASQLHSLSLTHSLHSLSHTHSLSLSTPSLSLTLSLSHTLSRSLSPPTQANWRTKEAEAERKSALLLTDMVDRSPDLLSVYQPFLSPRAHNGYGGAAAPLAAVVPSSAAKRKADQVGPLHELAVLTSAKPTRWVHCMSWLS
jgi:hypothetical protein